MRLLDQRKKVFIIHSTAGNKSIIFAWCHLGSDMVDQMDAWTCSGCIKGEERWAWEPHHFMASSKQPVHYLRGRRDTSFFKFSLYKHNSWEISQALYCWHALQKYAGVLRRSADSLSQQWTPWKDLRTFRDPRSNFKNHWFYQIVMSC